MTRSFPIAVVAVVVIVVCASWGQDTAAAPRPLPDELIPRQTLEKLYAAELVKYDPAQYDKLYEAHVLIEKYFLTDSAEDRRTIVKLLNQSALDPVTIGRLCRIRLGWPALATGAAYVNERIGAHDVQYFLGVPKNYDRTKPWPLVIRLPAANAIVTDPAKPPTADDVVRAYTTWVNEELKDHPDVITVMPLLNFDELYGPSLKGMNTVMQAMHHAASRLNVDAARVYMIGHGMAGHAVWNLALHYPTYFAAINPLAGSASAEWQRVRMLNLRNILAVVWADSDDKIIPPAQSTALVAILKNFKYDVVYEQTRGSGHAPSAQVAEKCYQALIARQREVYPFQVNLRSTRPDPMFNRVDWVQVYQPLSAGPERNLMIRHGTGRIMLNQNAHTIWAARTSANRIEARTDNVQTLRFYLNDQMADLSRPLTIVVNGKTRFEGILKPDIDLLMKDQLAIGRGWRYFTATVDLDLAPPTTRPATRPSTTTPASSQFFFTNDDGKTRFAADASNRPPFIHDGKPSVRAHVFSTDDGKTSWVAYLSKFSPATDEPLVKRPGDTIWKQLNTPAGDVATALKVPENLPQGKPVEIFPPAQ